MYGDTDDSSQDANSRHKNTYLLQMQNNALVPSYTRIKVKSGSTPDIDLGQSSSEPNTINTVSNQIKIPLRMPPIEEEEKLLSVSGEQSFRLPEISG